MSRLRAATVAAVLAICQTLSMLSSGTAFGQADPASDFRTRVENARQQMDADLSLALKSLDALADESVQIRQKRSLSETERAAHRDLYLLRARAYLQLLDNDKVAENFRELLRIDPFFGGTLAPREQEILVTLRMKESGRLEVGSDQSGAKIFINNMQAGVTTGAPMEFSLLPGDYDVRVEKEGYQAATARANITLGGTITLHNLSPQRRIPPVPFITDREGVEVFADNVSIGRTASMETARRELSPLEVAALEQAVKAAGFTPDGAAVLMFRQPSVNRAITVRFRRDCLLEESRSVTITSNQIASAGPAAPILWLPGSAVRMQSDMGILRVTSRPGDADVFIDNRLVGRTPYEREVCAGDRRVRVSHKIGSFSSTAHVARNSTEIVEAVLKPSIAFLGAVDASTGPGTTAPDLSSSLQKSLTSAVTGSRLAGRRTLSGDVQSWTDASTTELIAAYDRGDQNTVRRLLRVANETYDTPLLVAAVKRPAKGGTESPVDILVFWSEHARADRAEWIPSKQPDPTALLARLDAPDEVAGLAYENVLGINVADTALPESPVLIVSVEDHSSGAAGGLQPGDAIQGVDGSPATATQLAERVRSKKPGESVTLSVRRSGTPLRQVPIPVEQRPKLAPVFDASVFANALYAKLTVANAIATNPSDKALYSYNMALTRMRLGEWRSALDLLSTLPDLPKGVGTGRGAMLYFRARCNEELGQKDQAIALYKEAALATDQLMTSDGTTVAAVAKRRLSAMNSPVGE